MSLCLGRGSGRGKLDCWLLCLLTPWFFYSQKRQQSSWSVASGREKTLPLSYNHQIVMAEPVRKSLGPPGWKISKFITRFLFQKLKQTLLASSSYSSFQEMMRAVWGEDTDWEEEIFRMSKYVFYDDQLLNLSPGLKALRSPPPLRCGKIEWGWRSYI